MAAEAETVIIIILKYSQAVDKVGIGKVLFDRVAKKIMNMNRSLRSRSSVPLIYMTRAQGG